jgi:hypothetical protein
VDIQRIRQQLADRRLPAGFVNRLDVASPIEEVVGPAAGRGVAAEDGPDIALEANWQRRHRLLLPI